jgi:spore coat protein H
MRWKELKSRGVRMEHGVRRRAWRRELLCVLAVPLLLLGCGGGAAGALVDGQPEAAESYGDGGASYPGRPEGWTAETHGDDAAPSYETLFEDGKVLRLDIELTPEHWQAMLDDMTDMYGPFGGESEPQEIPPEALDACEPLKEGADCTIELAGETIEGTCESVWDGDVLACVPEKGGASPDPFVVACEGRAEFDDCQVEIGPGTIPGKCLQGKLLVCVPKGAVDACKGLTAGDECSIGSPEGGITGVCQALSGTVACITEPPPVPGQGGGGKGEMPLSSDRNPIWVPCTVRFDGMSWWHVGIRFKGNSTLRFTWRGGSYKLPFKLDFDEFEDDYPEIDDQRFFGFKRLAFANNDRDPTLLREKIAGDLFRKGGVPSPRRTFVRVYFDRGDGAQYMGLYTMAEVPDHPLFQSQFGADGGNLYKPEGTPATWRAGLPIDEDSFSKKTNEDEADWSDVEAAIHALHSDRTDAEAWRTELESRLDVDGFLRWLAINTVMQDWDTYGNTPHNYYLYGDPSDGGRLHWIPWDHNESLKASGGMMAPHTLAMTEVGDDWPLIRFLLDDPVYLEAYGAHVQAFVAGPFGLDLVSTRLQAAHDLIAPYVVGPGGEEEGYTVLPSVPEFESGVADLVAHVEARHAAVAKFLDVQ